MKIFKGVYSEEEAKRRYRELCLKHHPDIGGDTKTMQAINAEYREVLEKLKRKAGKPEPEIAEEMEIEQEIIDQISKIISIIGITIEIAGRWVWVTGNTYPHRKTLKEAGFFFAPKKKCWFWRSAKEKSRNREPKSLDWIRDRYGAKEYQSEDEERVLES